jgi:predicted glycosyltransferase
MDLVLSGGGTMTREAAIMGVPSYSFFRGDRGMVDETLEADGRLVLFSSPDDVAAKLRLERRSGEARIPDATKLIASLCDQIEAVGR